MPEFLVADYELETPLSLEKAAAVIAGEQSSGTFVRLPGETEQLRAASGATIEYIEETGSRSTPSLPCRIKSSRYVHGRIRLSWPLANMGPSLTNTLATVAGNLFELAEVSALRLTDVHFPDAFRKAYPGPAFGSPGTRRLSAVEKGPLIGTIIKPSIGLSAEETAALALKLAQAGIDFIKDDELQGNGPSCPLEDRVKLVMAALNDHADRTGKKVMYAFNITGEIDEMKRGADLVQSHGGNCLMISLHSIGLAGMSAIRKHAALPLHGHRNGWGLYSRSPHIGISFRAWQKFWRIAGADHLHVNGLANKFSESDQSVIDSALAIAQPLFPGDGQSYAAMPVFSSGQTAAHAAATYKAVGTSDLIFCAGGGIIGHPGGVSDGVASLRQAWEAALAGISAGEYAKGHPQLAVALETFGARIA